jgi:hypothetical protein
MLKRGDVLAVGLLRTGRVSDIPKVIGLGMDAIQRPWFFKDVTAACCTWHGHCDPGVCVQFSVRVQRSTNRRCSWLGDKIGAPTSSRRRAIVRFLGGVPESNDKA